MTEAQQTEHELRAIQAKLHKLREQCRQQGRLSPDDMRLCNRLAQTERLLLAARRLDDGRNNDHQNTDEYYPMHQRHK